jgi:hypothetical protein
MKLRIIQKPSLTSHPDIFWYHAQVRRFGIWIDCHDDPFMMLRYSADMMVHSWDTNVERVEEFVEHVMRGEEMFPKTDNKVVAEYEA